MTTVAIIHNHHIHYMRLLFYEFTLERYSEHLMEVTEERRSEQR
jgi:hypothetical protein